VSPEQPPPRQAGGLRRTRAGCCAARNSTGRPKGASLRPRSVRPSGAHPAGLASDHLAGPRNPPQAPSLLGGVLRGCSGDGV